ncbi:DUF2079 domain-containing protein [Saccharothrix sp. NRRL B-16348]|uniref:DUF2079 domain-containing protein n=1 Tax=Saccharothrix sp. NRRL B-16348 TaxID=1415542 RepID=UPI0006AE9103|nr:DUF2079 domain-containing protein [Saccharothrix sp. NRRL B-16348]
MLVTRPWTTVRPAHAVALGLAVLYASYALVRHHSFQTTGFDLGIFEQAVRSYAAGRWPTADLKGPGFPLLGDHFHPVVALLAPAYLIAPRAETLLVAQALLLAVSAIPVTRFAVDRLGGRGVVVGVAYGLSWGLHNTVAFDFHEVAFAVPLLAFSLEALARERWRAAIAWALPLVLVKEDLGLTVAAIGLYLVWRGVRHGWAVAAFGVSASAVVVAVVLPAVNPAGGYPYWGQLAETSGLGWLRLLTVVALLAPTGFLAARSPLIVVALPTLAWRFASGNAAYWGVEHHYSAVLMPVVFIAFLAANPRRVWVCATVTAAFTLALLLRPAHQPTWDEAQRATAADVLAMIPDDADVAASNRLAPHLTGRCRVSLFPGDAEWLVVSRPVGAEDEALLMRTASATHRVVAEADHVILLRRG